MLLDDPAGLFALRLRQRFRRLGLAMSGAVLRRLLLGLTPLGLFARGSQIDDGTHADAWPLTGMPALDAAEVLALAAQHPPNNAENLTTPPVPGNTRLFEQAVPIIIALLKLFLDAMQ